MAYSIALRVREIGLRKALGATSTNVSLALLRTGLVPVSIGAAVGLGVFALLSRSLGSLLYGVTPLDAGALVPAGLVLLAVAATATWLPARRAGRVDPVEALQEN